MKEKDRLSSIPLPRMSRAEVAEMAKLIETKRKIAKDILDPTSAAAQTIALFRNTGGELLTVLADEIEEQIEMVNCKNLSLFETKLTAQACVLDVLFHGLVQKSSVCTRFDNAETFLNAGLKAQRHYQLTIELLHKMKSSESISKPQKLKLVTPTKNPGTKNVRR